jgi:CubicO group peptidase (beta-lactamase class C family)
MGEVMGGYVERGVVPGVVTVVARRGEVHAGAAGTIAAGGSDPVTRDTLFRVTSMTKPVTAVAAMILVEECKLRLDEPVDRLLPELSGRRVLKRLDGPVDDTVPANRPITVRDLLTFTMGGYGGILAPLGTYPIQGALEVLSLAPPDPPSPDEGIRRLGTLPLIHQPGERWMYSTGDLPETDPDGRALLQPKIVMFRAGSGRGLDRWVAMTQVVIGVVSARSNVRGRQRTGGLKAALPGGAARWLRQP